MGRQDPFHLRGRCDSDGRRIPRRPPHLAPQFDQHVEDEKGGGLRAAVDEIAGRGQAGSVGAGRGESDSSGRARRSENTNDAGPLGLVLPQAHAEHALGFAGSYLLFYAVSLVGVIPRCTVLLASHALPQAHASQAVTGFWDLWQSCADPANAFSDFSSRGIVYKVLVGSDHVLFGPTILPLLHLMDWTGCDRYLRLSPSLRRTSDTCMWQQHSAQTFGNVV